MALTTLMTVLILLQYFFFGLQVGRARETYGIKAPAITGNEVFERLYRIQMNTLELLPLVISGLWLASPYLAAPWVAALGLVYLVGRVIYWRSYVADPATRSLGFALSMLPALGLLVTALVGSIGALVRHAA